jgi:hypothetical protein
LNVEAIALIADLASRGITLIAEPPDLLADSEAEISEPDRVLIRLHKDELLALLLEQRREAEIERLAMADGLNKDWLDAIRNVQAVFPEARLVDNPAPHPWEPGETVMRVIDPDRLFKTFKFGRCDICGGPAALVVPPWAAIDGLRRFCGNCFKTARKGNNQ